MPVVVVLGADKSDETTRETYYQKREQLSNGYQTPVLGKHIQTSPRNRQGSIASFYYTRLSFLQLECLTPSILFKLNFSTFRI